MSGANSSSLPAGFAHHLGPLVGVHLAPLDAYVADTGVESDPGLDLALDVGPQRTPSDREFDADDDTSVGAHRHVGNHAE